MFSIFFWKFVPAHIFAFNHLIQSESSMFIEISVSQEVKFGVRADEIAFLDSRKKLSTSGCN